LTSIATKKCNLNFDKATQIKKRKKVKW
jgi:hypothetical protein